MSWQIGINSAFFFFLYKKPIYPSLNGYLLADGVIPLVAFGYAQWLLQTAIFRFWIALCSLPWANVRRNLTNWA